MDHTTTLITGAAGFAGRHLLAHLKAAQPAARLVAWSRHKVRTNDLDDVEWQDVDVTVRDSVANEIRATRPDAVFHLAGSSHVGQSWVNTWVPLKTNVIGTHHLLDAIRAHHPRSRVLVVTSAMIYRPSPEPLDEEAPLGPASPYGFSKLAQDQLAMNAAREDGLDVVVARPFNHVGPGQDPTFFLSSFAKQIALIEAGLAVPEILVGNLDAERDLTDVRDVVDAYVRLLADGASGRPYNICSGETHRVGDLLDRLLALARVPIARVTDPARLRPNDLPRVAGNNARLRNELGWSPHRGMDLTLSDTLEYWRRAVAEGITPA
ncbi:MAG TPA: GDP-mannose 4,6-dehydratase [Vicinamibacterales bacterium]|nr:GDP-mannose 4,6-dehydratase [Vicinamibacterales bacterium]